MAEDKRKQFIECTYKVIEQEGLSAVNIRRIANDLGCTSATIYRHFDSLEHLICLACVKFLDPYVFDIAYYSSKANDYLEYNTILWQRFVFYSMQRPDVFEVLFLGKYSDNLSEIIYEYYFIYSVNFTELNGFDVTFMFNGNIYDRDYQFYRRAVTQRLIDSEGAVILAKVGTSMYRDLIQECIRHNYSEEERQKKGREFLDMHQKIIDRFRI